MRWFLEVVAAVVCALSALLLLWMGVSGLISLGGTRYFDSPPWFYAAIDVAVLTGGIVCLRQAWDLVREKDLF